MFSVEEKKAIAAAIEKVLLDLNHPEMPKEKPDFNLSVFGKGKWLWAEIKPNWTFAPVKRQYTDDMTEISGFGGGYEETCRNMVLAGLDWLDAHPAADPKFVGYKNIYGIINEENEDAKALSSAVVNAANGDCTGAMRQASISHVLTIKKMGWEKYVEESRARKIKEPAS